ncbi:transcriptional regulator, XRE family [Methanocella conradii HZ254]|uniref:Transcriptional regulator, XRE family n=1 Tax=Methanocella conradii (strain DSM 24694 / JCM 17849 / CGMCC 1.5162 / HZ254) TaxID=1041930 RepID=H8I8T4_METCZ|nr:helix-turn-helix domain-containing protein [Methanocella conradii]AFC99988.1 transcriptional regulator, XRE family [Methanocella conradii HZ254]MDI6897333.1 helix-turn-helix domain-containing protein [Methanocella conradii]
MTIADDVIMAAFQSDEEFRKTLEKAIKKDLGLSITEFGRRSGVSPSTLYKIMSGERDPNLGTLRQVIDAIREIEGLSREKFIAVIAARPVLDRISEREMLVDGKRIVVREYSAMTMEDAIVAAIKAERDGAQALVCAPIVSYTLEKIVRIPVATIMPGNSVVAAIETASRKVLTPS